MGPDRQVECAAEVREGAAASGLANKEYVDLLAGPVLAVV